MLYILDSGILINSHKIWYPIHRVPEFWSWLVHIGNAGLAKIPLELYEEIAPGSPVGVWIAQPTVKSALLLNEEVNMAIVDEVVATGYAPDLTDIDIEKLGRDPFLIAYAIASPHDRCVVSAEGSKPSRQRANRHVPDVCASLGVECKSLFELLDILDFTTDWAA